MRRYWYRFVRNRGVVAVAALLAISIVTASHLTVRSHAAIDVTVGENWRGAYDLLVAADGALAQSAADTDGLIEQNFASLTGGSGVTQRQLDEIARMPEVEVSAPLASVGLLGSASYMLLIGAGSPDGANSEFFSRPRAFDVHTSVRFDDGVRSQEVAETYGLIVVGATDDGPVISALESGVDEDAMLTGLSASMGASTATSGDGWWTADVSVPAVPELYTGLIAVEPDAERRLLGNEGEFLSPLVEADSIQAHGLRGLEELVDQTEYSYEYWNIRNGYDPELTVPLILSNSAYPRLFAELTIETLDLGDTTVEDLFTSERPSALVDTAIPLLTDAPRREPLLTTVELTQSLTPFALPTLEVRLPGSADSTGGTHSRTTPTLTPDIAGRAERHAPDSALASSVPSGVETSLVAVPQGRVLLSPTVLEQTYRAAQSASWSVPEGILYAPVGTYDPSDVLVSADAASYVPFGTYGAGSVTVVEPGEYWGAEIAPSFSGRGAVLPSPGAITTLRALSELRGTGGADIVRVRVAGIESYSLESLAAIEDVAQKIVDLGLDVRVVAGSSLAPSAVYLPNYFPDGDLGWTIEEWTSLGAAVRVEHAQMGGTITLLLVTLGGVTALAGVATALAAPGRRSEAALLSSQGWRRRDIRRWFLAEDTPGLLLVAGAGTLSLSGSGLPVAKGAVAVVVALYVLIAALGVATALRPEREKRGPSVSASMVRTPAQLGRRVARAHPATSLMSGAALVVLTVGAVAFAAAIIGARVRAGSSRLSLLVSAEVLLPQTTLACVALTAGVALFIAGIRTTVLAAAPQHRLIVSAGWGTRAVGAAIRSQISATLAPGALVAVAGGAAIALALASGSPATLVVGSLAVPIIAVGLALGWARQYARALSAEGALL